jgi:hypothetical protein
MSLKLIRQFADEIDGLLKEQPVPPFSTIYKTDEAKLKAIKNRMRSLRDWLQNEEARQREVDKPREAMWQHFLKVVDEVLKDNPHSGSTRNIGYFSSDNRHMLSTVSFYKLNGEETYFIVEISCRDGKLTDSIKMLDKRNSAFWDERAAEHTPRDVIVNNELYTIGNKREPSHHNGFGGRWHYIQFTDGELVKTCDLWARGTIPPCYRSRLKNNAKFLKEDEFLALAN